MTNQHKQILTGLINELRQHAPDGRFAELELQRYFRSALVATLVLADRASDAVLNYLWPALERADRRPDRLTVLLGGVAYREGTDETRQSGPEAVARQLRHLGGPGVQVFAADPRVRYWVELAEQDLSNPARLGYGLRHQEALQQVRVASDLLAEIRRVRPDVILMTTRHHEYLGRGQPADMRENSASGHVSLGLDPIEMIVNAYGRRSIVLGDTFDFFSDQDLLAFLAHGWVVFGLGKGHIRTRLEPSVTDRHRLEVAEQVLARLEAKQGDRGFDHALLAQAIEAQRAQVEASRAQVRSGLEEGDALAASQAELAATELELRFVGDDPDRRAMLQAKARWLRAATRALEAAGRPEVDAARKRYEHHRAAYLAGGISHAKEGMVMPSLLGLHRDQTALLHVLNALAPLVANPAQLLFPDTVSQLGTLAQHVEMSRWDIRQLRRTIERLAREVLTPVAQQRLAHALRAAQIPAELAFPEPLPAETQARLKAHYRATLPQGDVMMPLDDRVLFLPATVYVPDHPGPGGQLVRHTARDDGTMMASVKFAPDLTLSDQALKDHEWGKHHLQVLAHEVPIEIVEAERFPDFQGLPLEFRLYFEDLLRRGRILSTLDGEPQDRMGFVMPVQLAPGTPNHRRGRLAFLYFADDRRPLVGVSPTNHTPFIVEWKGTGLHIGGSPAALTPQVAELRAGRQAGGGVGRQTAVQIPGHMGSGEEVLTLARLRLTEAYLRGDPAPPIPLARVRFQYRDDPSRAEYEVVLRGAPTSQRLGHRFVDGSGGITAQEAARVFGQAAALLLALDPLNVHIALNGDNIYLNGYPTDTASQIDVPNERDPYGAFAAYFGYQLSFVLYGFDQIDHKDWDHPHTEFLKDWLDGFFEDLLQVRGRGQMHHPARFDRFRALPAEALARMDNPEAELVEPLMQALWEQYVAYWVVESRIRRGYDPTRESPYTINAEEKSQTKYRPQSREHAQQFLHDQREVLTHARGLVEHKGYPPLIYVEGTLAGRPFDVEAALREIAEKEAALDAMAGDYSAAYQLSFYPRLKPEYYTIVDPEGEEQESVVLLTHGRGYEKPNAAVQAERRQQTPTGLEEIKELGTISSEKMLRVFKGDRTVLQQIAGAVVSVVQWRAIDDPSAWERDLAVLLLHALDELAMDVKHVKEWNAQQAAHITISLADTAHDAETPWTLTLAYSDTTHGTFGEPIGAVVQHVREMAHPETRPRRAGGGGLGFLVLLRLAYGGTVTVEATDPTDSQRHRVRYRGLKDEHGEKLTSQADHGTQIVVEIPVAPRAGTMTLRQAVEAIRQAMPPRFTGALSQVPAAGLEERAGSTLAQWQAALQDPDRGLEIMQQVYPSEAASEKLPLWQGWMSAVAAARAAEGANGTRQPAFDPALPMTVAWTPGRAALPLGGRHVDYIGFMGGSLGFPILQGVAVFLQEAEGLNGAVEVYGLGSPLPAVMAAYPEGRPRSFSLAESWMQPPTNVTTVPQWDTWAKSGIGPRIAAQSKDGVEDHTLNYADGLVAGAMAFLRTPLGDPSGRVRASLDRVVAEGKGLRIAVVGDLTPGGQSTSSAIVLGITQALSRQYGWGLSTDQMVNVGYAERVWAGTQGGVKDHATMMNPPAFLGVSPVRVIQPLSMPNNVQFLALDTGISRDRAQELSPKLQPPEHAEAQIKGRTGIGYALGVLWLRQHHPELREALGPYNDPANPYGLGRELLPGGRAGLSSVQLLQLLREIPEDGLTREQLEQALPDFANELGTLFERVPALPQGVEPAPYRVREMLQFGFTEEARSLLTAQVLQQMDAGAITEDKALDQLIGIAKAAHHGNRVVQHRIALNQEDRVVELQETAWNARTSNALLDEQMARGEAFTLEDLALGRAGYGHLERSLEPIDLLVDLIEAFNQGHAVVREAHRGTAAAGVIVGAGLGGTVTVLVRPEYAQELQVFLQREYYDRLALIPQPPILIEPGKPSAVLALSQIASPAGAEEFLRIPAGATAGRVVILTPATAEAGLEAIERLRPADGEPPLTIGVIVEGAAQEARVQAGLEEAGVMLLAPLVNLTMTKQTAAEAVVELQLVAWQRQWETFVFEAFGQLRELGVFLQMLPAAAQTWLERIERAAVGVAA